MSEEHHDPPRVRRGHGPGIRHRDKVRARRRRPVPRSRSGMIGRRFERTGTEPITAQSALGVRLVLALLFIPLFLTATVVFWVWAVNSGADDSPSRDSLVALTRVCAVLTVFALVDLAVVLRRRRRERGVGR